MGIGAVVPEVSGDRALLLAGRGDHIQSHPDRPRRRFSAIASAALGGAKAMIDLMGAIALGT
jgi:hypothetical protein